MKLTPKTLDDIIGLAERAHAEMRSKSHTWFKLRRGRRAARQSEHGPAQSALVDKLNSLSDDEYGDLFAVYFTGRDADVRDVWLEMDASRQHAPTHHTDADNEYLTDKLDLAAALRGARARLTKAGW